ncbi:MAG: TfoX/Sxy family protein [Byssovorax sp.]
MAYDLQLAARVLSALADHPSLDPGQITEKKMFGGISYLVDGAMAVGVLQDHLVIRTTPEQGEELLKEPYVRPMDFTGKPMKGWLYVDAPAVETEEAMRRWVDRATKLALAAPAKKAVAKKAVARKAVARKPR